MAAEYCLGDHPKPASRDHLKTGRSIAAQNDDGLRRGSPRAAQAARKPEAFQVRTPAAAAEYLGREG